MFSTIPVRHRTHGGGCHRDIIRVWEGKTWEALSRGHTKKRGRVGERRQVRVAHHQVCSMSEDQWLLHGICIWR